MTCYTPLEGWYSKYINPSGKRSITFKHKEALHDKPVTVPCGQCIGCRLERSRQWAIRCMHEAQMWENNCFLTLTFDDPSLYSRETPFSLNKEEFQKFMKRLRKKFKGREKYVTNEGKETYPIRYYHCGEYGDLNGRPHYHACIFNFDFDDKVLYKISPSGHRLYTSETLNSLWPCGICIIGDVTFDSAAYVARYIMKKQNGEKAEEHYTVFDEETGEILYETIPEYTTMSLKPAIGYMWYEKYGQQVRDHDHVIVNEKAVNPPKYYDFLTSQIDEQIIKKNKRARIDKAKNKADNDPMRLMQKMECKKAQISKLYRNL